MKRKGSVKDSKKQKSTRSKTMLTVIVGIFGIMASLICLIEEKLVQSDTQSLMRKESGEGSYEEELIANYGNDSEEFSIIVNERQFTDSELMQLSEELFKKLPKLILNENESLDRVSKSLSLSAKYQDYPFKITWKSDREDIISSEGILFPYDMEEDYEKVNLTAVLRYQEFSVSKDFDIHILKQSRDNNNIIREKIQEEINRKLEETKNDSIILLPKMLDEQEIEWQIKPKRRSLWILIFTILIIPIMRYAYEYDRKKEMIKKSLLLEVSYPDFVTRLKLLILAGINVKNSLIIIHKDMMNSKNLRDKPLITELENIVNYLRNGISEEQAFEEFGNRCRGMYKKLSILLIVNLKRGNDKLVMLLEEECVKARLQRKENALRKADIAAVKLLLPMTLIMVMIMILIIIPAYFNFNGS